VAFLILEECMEAEGPQGRILYLAMPGCDEHLSLEHTVVSVLLQSIGLSRILTILLPGYFQVDLVKYEGRIRIIDVVDSSRTFETTRARAR